MIRVRFILFDAVGTLLTPEPAAAEAYALHGARFGSHRSAAEIQAEFPAVFARYLPMAATSEANERKRWEQVVAALLPDAADPAGLFAALWNHFAIPESWRVFPDVAPCWAALQTAGFKIGIASNFDARLIPLCRALTPLASAAAVFCSSQVGHAKPHPAFFTAIEARLQAAPDELLLVGDDPQRDIAAAEARGWHTLLIDRRAAAASVSVLHDLRELPSRAICAKQE